MTASAPTWRTLLTLAWPIILAELIGGLSVLRVHFQGAAEQLLGAWGVAEFGVRPPGPDQPERRRGKNRERPVEAGQGRPVVLDRHLERAQSVPGLAGLRV